MYLIVILSHYVSDCTVHVITNFYLIFLFQRKTFHKPPPPQFDIKNQDEMSKTKDHLEDEEGELSGSHYLILFCQCKEKLEQC